MRRSYLMEADELEFPDEHHEMAMHSQKIAVKHKLRYSLLTRCLTRLNPRPRIYVSTAKKNFKNIISVFKKGKRLYDDFRRL